VPQRYVTRTLPILFIIITRHSLNLFRTKNNRTRWK